MKEWKKPEMWELGIDKTESCLGSSGNDQFIPDEFEDPIDAFFGKDILGERS